MTARARPAVARSTRASDAYGSVTVSIHSSNTRPQCGSRPPLYFSLPFLLISLPHIIFSLPLLNFSLPPPPQFLIPILFYPGARSSLCRYIHPFGLYKRSLQPAHTSPPAYPPGPTPTRPSTPPPYPAPPGPHPQPPAQPERGASTARERRHCGVRRALARRRSRVIAAATRRGRRVTAAWEGRVIATATRRERRVTAAWERCHRGRYAAWEVHHCGVGGATPGAWGRHHCGVRGASARCEMGVSTARERRHCGVGAASLRRGSGVIVAWERRHCGVRGASLRR